MECQGMHVSMQSDALDLASPIMLHADVRDGRRGHAPDESLQPRAKESGACHMVHPAQVSLL